MNSQHSSLLPDTIRGVITAVKRQIRTYVWCEGTAIVVVVLGTAFWLGMAWDWAFEPSSSTRRWTWFIAGGIAMYVIYRYILRRAFVPITDASAAVLLERRFPQLQNHLITTVDFTSAPDRVETYHPQLVSATVRAADEAVADIRVADLFDRRPLRRAVALAAGTVVSIAAFAFTAGDVLGFWLQRIALSDTPWPRRVHLEVVGFPPNDAGERVRKIAADDDLELLVQAHADSFVVPDEVEIRFRLADGRRGRDTLVRVGDTSTNQGKFQLFRYEFKHVTGNLEFDVVGGDDRVRDLRLQVVDRPELYAIELECAYPEYLRREPRRVPVTGGMRIPEGTHLVLHAASTKPLTVARVHRGQDQRDATLEFSPLPHPGVFQAASPKPPTPSPTDAPQEPGAKATARQDLRWEYGSLTVDDVVTIHVTDIDGVTSREPYRISLSTVKDDVPQVAVRLSGIGSAITADAILPFVGRITDDYGLGAAWFEYQVDKSPATKWPLATQPLGHPTLADIESFDTRSIDPQSGQRLLQLVPKQRLTISLKATDRYDLSDEPRAGSSQQFTLDVVTVSDLLALIERRELALRQRFEAIYEKLTDTRNLLSRVAGDDKPDPAAAAPPASGAPADGESSPADPAGAIQRMLSRRRLRVAGSLQNVLQSTDETKGVAEGFDDLGQELVNNRIENPDLRSRLGEQIAQPLHQIADERMPQLAAQLKLVEERLEDVSAAAPELKTALAQADEVLVAMRQVLDKMIELETYNEVVALLRGIITDQEEINRRTKERQKEKLKELLE